jgi:hypothetical protein
VTVPIQGLSSRKKKEIIDVGQVIVIKGALLEGYLVIAIIDGTCQMEFVDVYMTVKTENFIVCTEEIL